MKKNKMLLTITGGAACAALTAYAVWDSLAHHAGRLVYPMHSYAFQLSDIPMLAALALDTLYVFYLAFLLVRGIISRNKQAKTSNRTRRLSPKLGLFGFLGFLGFLGFWSYGAWEDLSPFAFFVFFGFFGFYFEGKMSNILMDERYQENAARAQRTAYKIGFSIIFLLLITASHGSSEATAVILMVGVSLALGLTMFLNEYLLYRYDHDDAMELEDE